VGLSLHDDGETIWLNDDSTQLDGETATKIYFISARVTAGLGVKPNDTYQKINAAFERLGLPFDAAHEAYLSPDGTQITIRQTQARLRLIPGILHLLENGFILGPPTSDPSK